MFNENEEEILKKALQHLAQVLPVGKVTIHWKNQAKDVIFEDAHVEFENTFRQGFQVEMKFQLRREGLRARQLLLDQCNLPRLLVTRYVTPPLADEMREQNIQFLDTVGNMFIHQKRPFVYAFIKGNRLPRTDYANRRVKLFREAGLKVLFYFLCNQNAVGMAYREIAENTGLALGTIHNVFADLKRFGYVRTYKGTRTLQNVDKLIDGWVDAYPIELRPNLNLRRFTTDKLFWWKEVDITQYNVLLGGEPAAEILTGGFLHPEITTLYTGNQITKLANILRFRKDKNGNTFVYDKFWLQMHDNYATTGVVPPLLAYADLMNTNQARNIEAAKIIREKYLE